MGGFTRLHNVETPASAGVMAGVASCRLKMTSRKENSMKTRTLNFLGAGKVVPSEQVPVYSDTNSTVWHVEDYGNSTLEITKTIKGFTFEWLDFDEDAGDWVGVPVAYEDIKRFLPDALYA